MLYWSNIFCRNSDCGLWVRVWKYLKIPAVWFAKKWGLDSPSVFLLPYPRWPPCTLWENQYILDCLSIYFYLFSCSTHMFLHLSVQNLSRSSFGLTALQNFILHGRNSIDSETYTLAESKVRKKIKKQLEESLTLNKCIWFPFTLLIVALH